MKIAKSPEFAKESEHEQLSRSDKIK